MNNWDLLLNIRKIYSMQKKVYVKKGEKPPEETTERTEDRPYRGRGRGQRGRKDFNDRPYT